MTDINTAFNTTAFYERINHTKSRILDGVNAILDDMEAKRAPPSPPPVVARRSCANIMRLWMFCDRSLCRRTRCCRGEPLQCLRIGLHLVPLELIDNVLPPQRKARR